MYSFHGWTAVMGHGILMLEVQRPHSDKPLSVGLFCTSDQRPLPDNIRNSQQTDIHARGGIRTVNPSQRAAADPRLRSRGLRDWHISTEA